MEELNIVALTKDGEQFLFLWDDCEESKLALFKTFSSMAHKGIFNWQETAAMYHASVELIERNSGKPAGWFKC